METKLTTPADISRLEALVLAQPQVDLRTEHALFDGHYARTIFIPAGTVLIGARHKTDHMNVAMGDITVTTDSGPTRLTGMNIIPTRAGSKRAGYAHADTVWITICKTQLTDIEAIENELVEEADRLQTRQGVLPYTPFLELEN